MKINTLKKGIVSLALVGSFILGVGAFSSTNAQDWRWNRQRRGNNGQVDRNGNIDRNRNGIDDRYEVRGRVDINQNGIPDQDERYGRNRGYNSYNNNRATRLVGYYDRFGRFHATGYYDAYGRFHRY